MAQKQPVAQAGSSRRIGGTPHISALAEWQLEKWREYMRTNFRVRHAGGALICTWCEIVIIRLIDDLGYYYSWEYGQFEAACIAHLRNNHRDVEEKVYGE